MANMDGGGAAGDAPRLRSRRRTNGNDARGGSPLPDAVEEETFIIHVLEAHHTLAGIALQYRYLYITFSTAMPREAGKRLKCRLASRGGEIKRALTSRNALPTVCLFRLARACACVCLSRVL